MKPSGRILQSPGRQLPGDTLMQRVQSRGMAGSLISVIWTLAGGRRSGPPLAASQVDIKTKAEDVQVGNIYESIF